MTNEKGVEIPKDLSCMSHSEVSQQELIDMPDELFFMTLRTNEILRNFEREKHTLEMSYSKYKPIIIVGPSGSGKSTLIQDLTEEYPDSFGFSVSYTTREPREGEIHG